MSHPRYWLYASFVFLICSQTACNMVPQQRLRLSQRRAHELAARNQAIIAQAEQNQAMLDSLAMERDVLAQQNSQLESSLGIAEQRLVNLQAERSVLQEKYKQLLVAGRNQQSPLSAETTKRFQELARRYPEFEFDPETGMSKFHSDILFASGSDRMRSAAQPLLNEFANILNTGDARRLNIIVAGHTDDQPIQNAKGTHPTNWHLSTNRANSVLLQLTEMGILDARLGAIGYGETQPIVANIDANSRQRNRRVEIYVLSPDAVVAGWNSHSHR